MTSHDGHQDLHQLSPLSNSFDSARTAYGSFLLSALISILDSSPKICFDTKSGSGCRGIKAIIQIFKLQLQRSPLTPLTSALVH